MNLLLPSKYGIPDIGFDIKDKLTKQEIEIFKWSILDGHNIAWELDISPNTVTTHLKNIRIKTGLRTKGEMNFYLGAKQDQLFN